MHNDKINVQPHHTTTSTTKADVQKCKTVDTNARVFLLGLDRMTHIGLHIANILMGLYTLAGNG